MLDRLKQATQRALEPVAPARTDGTPLAGSWSSDPLVPLTGTNTFCQDAIALLLERRRVTLPVMLELAAVAQREPHNAADPNAVAVLVDGERIGYLPGGTFARDFDVPVGSGRPLAVQLFAAVRDGKQRAVGWAWYGPGTPRWTFSAEPPPPMTSREQDLAQHHQTRARVAGDVAAGGQRAASTSAGMVNGVHYLELVEPIKALKREGRLEEALELCMAGVAGAERDRRGGAPAPWYTEQAAIVARKLDRRDAEVAVLRRWLSFLPADQRASTTIGQRLTKLEG